MTGNQIQHCFCSRSCGSWQQRGEREKKERRGSPNFCHSVNPANPTITTLTPPEPARTPQITNQTTCASASSGPVLAKPSMGNSKLVYDLQWAKESKRIVVLDHFSRSSKKLIIEESKSGIFIWLSRSSFVFASNTAPRKKKLEKKGILRVPRPGKILCMNNFLQSRPRNQL